jgi:hypothetical protein
MKALKICIAPLDWGLGHATRCIPIIQSLQTLGHRVYIAAEGHHAVILREAFPDITILPLRGYRVRYTKNGRLFFLHILLQGPKILYSAIHEYLWLKKKQNTFHFDLIISDNRVGFFHRKIKSVFITHQLRLIMPYEWATRLFQSLQYAWLKKFSACWVPDYAGENNLSGTLANPIQLPHTPLWYMGCLSRLYTSIPEKKDSHYKTHSDELVNIEDWSFVGIVSGPEPQRTLLEKKLWEGGNINNQPFLIVAGLPMCKDYQRKSTHGQLVHHLQGPELAAQLVHTEYIICRGGYTSLMELIPFGKKLILVPTPGQTEQLYLGQLWEQRGWALCFDQNSFDIATALSQAASFSFTAAPFIPLSTNELKTALNNLYL